MPADEKSPIVTGTSDVPSAVRGVEETGAGRLVTSAALIGAGMLIEPELLGGALLGAGVMYGLPLFGRFLRPGLFDMTLTWQTVASMARTDSPKAGDSPGISHRSKA